MTLIEGLPPHLAERARMLRGAAAESGEFVLYWMQTAMRLDENPALDLAKHRAVSLNLPLLIYQGLSPRHRYASDRHHTFIMQGAADLQAGCREQGITYAFVLEQSGDELRQLLQRAAMLVVEDMPTDPSRMFQRAAMKHGICPVVAVDTACIVPMRLVGRAYERAFEFRNVTRKLYKERLQRAWPTDVPMPAMFDVTQLPFVPLDLSRESIPDLVAACDIDHLVTPVLDTPGGSCHGYARWEEFKEGKLRRYADNRNDALKDANSRMSAYLHYGMVSPTRVAREAANIGGPGAEKYLDELLIWRELAYGFCFYRADHARYTALPLWARETLEEHRSDRRPQQYTWEELARGVTLDAFWNAAQKSLLVQGQLHNNVRMTWGKALLAWCTEPRVALERLIDLNHRYALDGRDPASFGGLLWCLGQFDRPFEPSEPIYGRVRTRPTWEHARRLDVKRYTQQVTRPTCGRRLRVAVVGAGLAGSLAARTLEDLGHQVEIFEKSERPSGRMSTRRTVHSEFDHGAQYFTCRDRTFRRYVDSWQEAGAVAVWDKPIAVYQDGVLQSHSRGQRYVCLPSMNELGRRLTRLMTVHYGVRIQAVQHTPEGWCLQDDAAHPYGPFDRVITALPAYQAADLLIGQAELAQQLRMQTMDPCWAAMVTLAEPLAVDWGGAFINSGGLSWMARNQTKPGRNTTVESLVLHASPEWTRTHWEAEKATVAEMMVDEMCRALGLTQSVSVSSADAHRWAYARPVSTTPLPYRCLFHADRTLIACGDWAAGGRVEGAFLSGAAAVGMAVRAT